MSKETTKLQPITLLPSVKKIGNKNANKFYGGKRNFSKYVTKLILEDDERSNRI